MDILTGGERMGFVIYIVRPDLAPLTGGELRKYFRARKNMEVKQDGAALVVTYRNPLTGAGFVFNYNPAGLKDASGRDSEAYQNLQLSCSIDYLRPSFFAYEASVELDRFVSTHGHSVLNPQSRTSPEEPVMFIASEMLKDWQSGNARAIVAHTKQKGPVPTIHPKYSGMIWKYLIVKKRIEEKLGREVLTPEMEVMRSGKGSVAHALLKWTNCAPMALPACQSVLIQRVKRKGFLGIGRKVEKGLARYEDVLAAMKPFMKPLKLEKPSYTVPVLMPEGAGKALKAFRQIPLAPLPKQMKPVPLDSFVDVIPAKKL